MAARPSETAVSERSAVETRTVSVGEDGMRLDRWFKTHYATLPHSRLEKLLRTGQVRVGGGRDADRLRRRDVAACAPISPTSCDGTAGRARVSPS